MYNLTSPSISFSLCEMQVTWFTGPFWESYGIKISNAYTIEDVIDTIKKSLLTGIRFYLFRKFVSHWFWPFLGNSEMCHFNVRIECIICDPKAVHSRIHVVNAHWFFRTLRKKIFPGPFHWSLLYSWYNHHTELMLFFFQVKLFDKKYI